MAKDRIRVCRNCEKRFSLLFKNGMTAYCSESCRAEVRREVQKTCRENNKAKMKYGTPEYIGSQVYLKYKQRSPKRGLEFSLTVDDFVSNVKENCYYCGDFYHGVGLDRVDNDKGYIKSNIVSCCQECNFMKRSLSLDVFIDKCNKIATKHKKNPSTLIERPHKAGKFTPSTHPFSVDSSY